MAADALVIEGWIGIKLDEIIRIVKSNADNLDKLKEKIVTLESNLMKESQTINKKLDELISNETQGPPVGFVVTTEIAS